MPKTALSARVTARVASPITGDLLYHERARRALPLLVRQAKAKQPIIYSNLADELDMPNARNLNYPLGSIGRALEALGKAWKTQIPPIQALVISKTTGMPGEGIGWFLRRWGDYEETERAQKRELVARAHAEVFAYPRWNEVLEALSLEAPKPDFSQSVEAAARFGGGESDRHLEFKEFIAKLPSRIRLPPATHLGRMESKLPSGDCLDVSFFAPKLWIGAEVKSEISNEADIVRGLFQCVKYQAVMKAVLLAENRACLVRVVLVLEGAFPDKLMPLRNLLGVEVCDTVKLTVTKK